MENTKQQSHSRNASGVGSGLVLNPLDNQGQQYSGLEDLVMWTEHVQDYSILDSESGKIEGTSELVQLFGDGVLKVDEVDRLYGIMEHRFVSSLGSLGEHTTIVPILKNSFSSFTGQARLQSFLIFSQAMEKKYSGNGNEKFGWYGSSKNEMTKIIGHGFSHFKKAENNEFYGSGICLCPDYSSLTSVKSSIIDEDGLRHVLLCRIILGEMEFVLPGSKQYHPSSEVFDSGVDNLSVPRKYIVWSTHMNTHILPEYIISFKAPSCLNCEQFYILA